MSYFLCLAVPPEATVVLGTAFDARVVQVKDTGFPIGAATRGRELDWESVLLQYGSSSAFLVGKGATRRTHNNDKTDLLGRGVRRLLEQEGAAEVRLLLHWFSGTIAEEQVPVAREERLRLGEWQELLESDTGPQENVCYLVSG